MSFSKNTNLTAAFHIMITAQLNLRISARLVYNSLWTSVGTISVHLNGKPWGNVRSVADGVGANSTGLPVFFSSVFMLTWRYTCVVRVRVYVLCVRVHVLVCYSLAVCMRACLRTRVYACVRMS